MNIPKKFFLAGTSMIVAVGFIIGASLILAAGIVSCDKHHPLETAQRSINPEGGKVGAKPGEIAKKPAGQTGDLSVAR